MPHYYRKDRYGSRYLVSLTIHGQTLEFLTYRSLFSGRAVDLGTKLLLENIVVPREGVVLDMGCGYGVIGITVSKLNPRLKVYMVDINPLAVKTARYNAKLNGVESRVIVLMGDRYEPVKNMRFNAIYSNPPLAAGREIVEDIVLGARKYLLDKGWAQFVIAQGGRYLAEKARSLYKEVKVTSKKGYILLYLKP